MGKKQKINKDTKNEKGGSLVDSGSAKGSWFKPLRILQRPEGLPRGVAPDSNSQNKQDIPSTPSAAGTKSVAATVKSTSKGSAKQQPPKPQPNQHRTAPEDAQHLVPIPLSSGPAPLPQRMKFLQVIHSTLVEAYPRRALLKRVAIDLEHKTAADNSTATYRMAISRLIKSIKDKKVVLPSGVLSGLNGLGSSPDEAKKMEKKKRTLKKRYDDIYCILWIEGRK
jgi:hypothetical protein